MDQKFRTVFEKNDQDSRTMLVVADNYLAFEFVEAAAGGHGQESLCAASAIAN